MKKTLAIIALILFACFSASSVHAYTNTKYGFSIDSPAGWTTQEPSYAAVVFLGPIESGFQVNVNVQVEATAMTLEQYKNAGKQSLETLVDFHIISEGSRTINGTDAYEVVYNFTYSSVTVQQKQVWLVAYGKAFVIVYSAVPSAYSTYLIAFENSVQTFRIISVITFLGLEWWVWLIIIVIIVVAAVAIAAIILRRRKRPAATTPIPQTEQHQPSPPSP